MRKSWKQKLGSGKPPHIEVLTKNFGGAPAGAQMLISQPREVESYIRGLAPGTVQTVADMRAALANAHGADISCPISTGIFARITAEAALDDLLAGTPLDSITPFWRVIDPESALAAKLSCGPRFITEQRANEASDQSQAVSK